MRVKEVNMPITSAERFRELVDAAKKAAGGDEAWAFSTLPQRNEAIYAAMRKSDERSAKVAALVFSHPTRTTPILP